MKIENPIEAELIIKGRPNDSIPLGIYLIAIDQIHKGYGKPCIHSVTITHVIELTEKDMETSGIKIVKDIPKKGILKSG